MNDMYPQRKMTFERVKPIAVFDIETVGLGGDMIIGGYVTELAPYDVKYFTNMTDFILDVVLTKFGNQFDWYAHNGAHYDFLYIVKQDTLNAVLENGFEIQPVLSGFSCRGLKIFKDSQVFRLKDSYCLSFLSLAKFSKTFAPEYTKKEFDHENVKFDATNPEHMEYLKFDCLGLLHGLLKFQELMREYFNTPLAWTIAGSSIRAWRQTIPEQNDYVWIDKEKDAFIRNAYHGGLCIIRNALENKNAYYYDMNSAYAWSMLQGVPVGNPKIVSNFVEDKPGFYKVFVDTKDSNIPVIPFNAEKSTVYPLGTFMSYASTVEINFAREMGHDVDIIEGVVFPRIDTPFSTFINRCSELRHRDYFGPIGTLAKGLQNNLYGKFGQSRSQAYYKLQNDEPEPEGTPWFVELQQIKDYRDAVKQLWYQYRDSQKELGMVHWAAWITANVRVRMLRTIVAEGWDNFIYCDTDSIVLKNPAKTLDIGSAYGQWKLEYENCTIWPIASKTYLLKLNDGTFVIHAKGVPRRLLNEQHLLDAFNNKQVQIEFISITSIMGVIRGKPIAKNTFRTISRPTSATNAVFNKETRHFEPHRIANTKDGQVQLNIYQALKISKESESLQWLRKATTALLESI